MYRFFSLKKVTDMHITLINTLAQPLKSAAKFINYQEQASGLSTSRFIQDTGTCLLPKAVFSRSAADLAENAFLELSESGLVYFAPALIGEKISRKIFSKKLENTAKKLIPTPAAKLLETKNPLNKKVLPVKAGIALSAMLIPLTEFTLNYFKNIFTIKAFNKADFNNIAALENKKEDKALQNKVEKSAKKNILRAVSVFAGCLGLGTLIAKKGADSKTLQNLSELILAPGTKLFKNNQKAKNFFNKYFSIDFAQQDGKLVLSKGQLTSCVLIGGAGYFGASKDRGKQNFLETLFRFPVVGFYIITGSELFEKGFKKLLVKMEKCKETIGKNLEVPSFEELEKLAKSCAQRNGSKAETEFKKLAKQKTLISGVPYLFSIGFMGFFVAGISNLFTKYRFTKEQKNQHYPSHQQLNPTFKAFRV